MESFLVRNGLVPHFVAVVFFIALAALFFRSLDEAAMIRTLQTEGQVTQAIVVRVHKTHRDPNIKITARYFVDTKPYLFEKYVYVDVDIQHADLLVGDSVKLLYYPKRPWVAIFADETVPRNNKSMIFTALGAIFFFGVIFRLLWQRSTSTS